MRFEDLIKEVRGAGYDSVRKDSSGYFEVVFLNKELQNVSDCFDKFFGQALYPSKNSLSFEVQKTIDDFGGIMPGQTLYFYSKDKSAIFAMLWPWQDGIHTTIKIAKK